MNSCGTQKALLPLPLMRDIFSCCLDNEVHLAFGPSFVTVAASNMSLHFFTIIPIAGLNLTSMLYPVKWKHSALYTTIIRQNRLHNIKTINQMLKGCLPKKHVVRSKVEVQPTFDIAFHIILKDTGDICDSRTCFPKMLFYVANKFLWFHLIQYLCTTYHIW